MNTVLTAFLLWTLLPFITTKTVPTIGFVSTNPTSQGGNQRQGSTLGGLTLYIRSSDAYFDIPDTRVLIGVNECDIQATLSSPSQIACIVPSSDSLGPADVQVFIGDTEVNCPSSLCTFTYVAQVSTLDYIVPSAVMPFQRVQIGGNFDQNNFAALQLNLNGQYFCDFRSYKNQQFDQDDVSFVSCKVGAVPAGTYTTNLKSSEGVASNGDSSWSVANNEKYNLAIVPQIKSISQNTVTTCGTKLIIKGNGFSANSDQNQVNYGNNICEIVSSTYSTIECDLVSPTAPASGPSPGHSGLRSRKCTFKSTIEGVISSQEFINSQGPFTDILSTELFGDGEKSAVIVEGFFKAPKSGSYVFYLSSAGKSALYLASDPLTQDNLQAIAHIEQGTGLRDFSDSSEANQKSSTITLTAGKFYFIRAISLDSGNGHLSIGVKTPGQNSVTLIPFNLLFTYETVPQITVQTNGILSSCAEGSCDLNFIQKGSNVPVIQDFGLSYNVLSVYFQNGQSLDFSNFTSISLGPTPAVILSYDSSIGILSAFLPVTPLNDPSIVAGSYVPRVVIGDNTFSVIGLTAQPLIIYPEIMDLATEKSMDGTYLEFDVTGRYYGFSLYQPYGTSVDIGGVPCTITLLENYHLKCATKAVPTSGPFNLTVNGLSTQMPLTFSSAQLIQSTAKTYDSSEGAEVMKIIGNSGINFKVDTTAVMRNEEDNTLKRCRSCATSETEVSCSTRDLGPGNFTLLVTQFTPMDSFTQSSATFEIPLTVDSIEPALGSQLGGTVLTITGSKFTGVSSDYQVIIGSNNAQCDILEVNETVITCMTQPNNFGYIGVQNVNLIHRSLYTAKCSGSCIFTFSNDYTPSVTTVSDEVLQIGAELTLFGVKFPSTTQVTIGGVTVAPSFISSTRIVIQVPNLPAGSNIALSATDPTLGNFNIDSRISLSLNLEITDFSPKQGSTAGTVITIEGQGYSEDTVVMIGGQECEVLSQTATEIQCKAGQNFAGTISLKQGNLTFECDDCVYATSAALTPVISGLTWTPSLTNGNTNAVSSLSLELTGDLLQNSNSVKVLLVGETSTLESTSNIQGNTVQAAFSNPVIGKYTLEVRSGPYIAEFKNIATENTQITINPVIDQTTSTSSSFAGGLELELTGAGFPSELDDEAQITIGGFNCPITSTSFAKITCTVPAFVTQQTYNSYGLGSAQVITGTYFSSNQQDDASAAFDDSTSTVFQTQDNDCFFGVDIGASLEAQVTEIQLFPQGDIQTYLLQGAVIEGSNDGTTYSEILSLDSSIYDGWNVYPITTTEKYRYIRFNKGDSQSSCQVAELRITGVTFSSAQASPSAVLTLNGVTTTLDNIITYSEDSTPIVESLDVLNGTAIGGTTITLTGQRFSSNVADIQVEIDGSSCQVTTADDTHIACVTGALDSSSSRTERLNGQVNVFINGKGKAVANGITFRYLQRWSDDMTWGCDGLPLEGDSVHVPAGMNLLVDISPPKLVSVIVEGALIFDDADINFDCEYLLIRNGLLEIGTEDKPISSKIVVTLHGDANSPNLPIFGNKVIGAYEGVIDIHGTPRQIVSTRLASTAKSNDSEITVEDQVDFQIGEEIIISTTSDKPEETERRTIKDISGTTITLDSPLLYTHISETVTVGTDQIEIKAVVSLLSRNIVIQGDEDSGVQGYGAHMLFYEPILGSTTIRMSYAEISNAGQAGFQGRYPLNFYNAGDQSESYITGCSIHDSFQRGIVITGTDHLTVNSNILYSIQGHGIKLASGMERYNKFSSNVAVSCVNGEDYYSYDDEVAAFEINNPSNSFNDNIAIGSNYGYRFSLGTTSEGYISSQVCPSGEKFGEFKGNMAFSNLIGGLMMNSYAPRTFSCLPEQDDTLANPFSANAPQAATLSDFVAFRNGEVGVRVENVGAVTFTSMKLADHPESAVEILKADLAPLNSTVVSNSVLIGKTSVEGFKTFDDYRGIIAPQSDNLFIQGVTFENYDADGTAIDACFDCGNDMGVRTVFLKNLKFNSVQKRTDFGGARSAILRDLDGTLTGLSTGGSVVANLAHLQAPECTSNSAVYDGFVCTDSVEIKRLSIAEGNADGLRNKALNIAQLTSSGVSDSVTDLNSYDNDQSRRIWSVPLMTGYNYQIDFGQSTDFEELYISPSPNAVAKDGPTTIAFKYNYYKETFDVLKQNNEIGNSTQLWNMFTATSAAQKSFGDWFNDVDNKKLYVAITGKAANNITVKAYECKDNCPNPDDEESDLEPFTRLWSNATQWPNGRLPQSGESVTIPSSWQVILDIDPPALRTLEIQGQLAFNSSRATSTLSAQNIWVRGKLVAGAPGQSFDNTAIINLVGDRTNEKLVVNNVVDASNKALIVTGELSLYGKQRNTKARLSQIGAKGSKEIQVDGDVSAWVIGDKIVISGSQYSTEEHEVKTIMKITNNVITLDTALGFFHYGAEAAYDTQTALGAIDMRTEVLLLTRNIRIEGSNEDNWGARVIITEQYGQDQIKTGIINMEYTSLNFCGQDGTGQAGLSFEYMTNVPEDQMNSVKGSVISNCISGGVSFDHSQNIEFADNIVLNTVHSAIFIGDNNDNITIDGNSIIYTQVADRPMTTPSSAIYITNSQQADVIISNNIASGCQEVCYYIASSSCGSEGSFINNVAHSSNIGHYTPTLEAGCSSLNNFTAYKTSTGILNQAQEVRLASLMLTDNKKSIILPSVTLESKNYSVSNSFFASFALKDCSQCYSEGCSGNIAISLGENTISLNYPSTVNSQPDTSLGGKAIFEGNTFANYKNGVLSQCSNNKIFATNSFADITPFITISQSVLIDVDTDSLVSFSAPPQDKTLCGGLDCTNLNNLIIEDEDGSFIESTGLPGVIIPNNPALTETSAKTCTFTQDIQGFICESDNFGVLAVESPADLGANSLVIPFTINNSAKGFSNKISPVSKCSSETPSSLSRYVSIVETQSSYNLAFEGSSPNTLRTELQAIEGDSAIITISYNDVRVVSVTNIENSQEILPYIKVDNTKPTITQSDLCGTNSVDLEDGTVEIKLVASESCKILLQKSHSLVTTVRYDISVEKFFEQGGLDPFINKVADILNINPSRIKVTRVKSGSTIIDFTIAAANQDKEQARTELEGLHTALQNAVNNDDLVIYEAPVLNFSTEVVIIGEENTIPETISAKTKDPAVFIPIISSIAGLVGLGFAIYMGVRYYKMRNARRSKKIAPMVNREVLHTSIRITTEANDDDANQKESARRSGHDRVISLSTLVTEPDQELLGRKNSTVVLPSETDVSETETPNEKEELNINDLKTLKRKRTIVQLNPILENLKDEEENPTEKKEE